MPPDQTFPNWEVALSYYRQGCVMPTDLEFAKALLDGIVETDRRGRLRLRYLEEGSSGELNARVALSKLLRSDKGLNRQLRDFLAELFDPNPPARQQRKLIFAFRRPGKKTDPYANVHVFVEVATAVKSGSTAAAAIADTAQQYGISEELEPISKFLTAVDPL